MKLPRSSGVVLHPTSLPAGVLGREALAFVDWLAAAGQSWWQILPLGPPDDVGSPYAAASAFAASPALLAEPDAHVSAEEEAGFRSRHAFWIGDWERCGGSVADQVRFEREWGAVREHARARGIGLIGDVPIYVAQGSCDHRTRPELFLEDVVAGAPPDALGPQGQLWGNPLWDWDALAREGYRWWVERLRRVFEQVDVARLDHFRAFAAYWAVPRGARSARQGEWRPGPGAALFEAAERELGELALVAEDLGLITPDVVELRDELGIPGMVVMLWAYGGAPDSPHRLENHREHAVVYTSTHDTDTLAGHFGRRRHRQVLRDALGSRATLAMLPLQDVLGLGSEARMNTPGTTRGNWQWRLEAGALTDELAAQLREETAEAGRYPPGSTGSPAATTRRPPTS